MIHITLGKLKKVPAELDGLGRSQVGFDPAMSPQEAYEANHGEWVMGERADKEKFALFSFDGLVRQAIEIESIEVTNIREPGDTRGDRKTLHGRILHKGHPVHDKYVGKTSPITGVRNPVTYVDDLELEANDCGCGCGGKSGKNDFIPGHDQTAVHDRVRQVGTVREFINWFDALSGPWRAKA